MRRTSFSSASIGRSSPNAASASAVVNSSIVGLVAVLVAALAVFGTVQWRSALDAKGEVEDLLMVDDLVSASRLALDDDPELALLLAMQSVRETVDLGFATEEAVDAVHFALQEFGVQYDVEPGTPVAVRSGPFGSVGVYALTPHELMETAESAVQRTLTDAECEAFLSDVCPAAIDVPENLRLRDGLDSYGAIAPGPQALAGTTLTISATGWGDDEGFVRELREFIDRTGIAVEFTPDEARTALDVTVDEPGLRPDVFVGSATPAWVGARAMDIGGFVEPETLQSDFGEYLLSTPTVMGVGGGVVPADGEILAIPIDVDLKGLVYYPEAEFREAGYEIPNTWDELVALSHQIAADGGTPWCFAFESGYGSGWPGTDFIESLVMRVPGGGVDTYDAWTTGQVGFTSAAVMEAGRLADDLIFEPGFVHGGPATISQERYENPIIHVLPVNEETGEKTEPECWMFHQADFFLQFLQEGGQLRSGIDFFMLPPIDPSQPTPAIGAATFASALVDTPEVRAFMEFVASPEWGERWASDSYGGFTSPNQSIRYLCLRPRRPRSHGRGPNEGGVRRPVHVGVRVVQIRRLRPDAHRNRLSDRRRRAPSVLPRDARLGGWNPQHRSGLRRPRRRVGRPQSGERDSTARLVISRSASVV